MEEMAASLRAGSLTRTLVKCAWTHAYMGGKKSSNSEQLWTGTLRFTGDPQSCLSTSPVIML